MLIADIILPSLHLQKAQCLRKDISLPNQWISTVLLVDFTGYSAVIASSHNLKGHQEPGTRFSLHDMSYYGRQLLYDPTIFYSTTTTYVKQGCNRPDVRYRPWTKLLLTLWSYTQLVTRSFEERNGYDTRTRLDASCPMRLTKPRHSLYKLQIPLKYHSGPSIDWHLVWEDRWNGWVVRVNTIHS